MPTADAGGFLGSTGGLRRQVAGQWVDYALRRSRRRRGISLTIDDRGFRVSAPLRASMRRIEEAIDAHQNWIVRKLSEWQSRRVAPMLWCAGAIVMVLGKPRMLTPVRDSSGNQDERLYLVVERESAEELKIRTVEWLHQAALAWFEQRVAHFAPLLEVAPPRIGLTNARTRWGVCHPEGRIRLHWRLIQMPPALIDYVVVHELAHLRVANHSRRFWRCVESMIPDYKERQHMLRKQAHQYLFD